MFLVVGLGNPGKKYEKTRHNIGFMALDLLRESEGFFEFSEWKEDKKFKAEVSGATINAKKIILAKPTTFMNNSGESVQKIASYYQVPRENIIVVHDDKDINLGEIKVQSGRGHAGHNGIKSIFEHVGDENITRIRVGIKAKNDRKMQNVPKFVLGKFGIFERAVLNNTLQKAKTEILNLVS